MATQLHRIFLGSTPINLTTIGKNKSSRNIQYTRSKFDFCRQQKRPSTAFICRAGASDGSQFDPLKDNGNPFEGLKLDRESGDLVDEKTGKALNSFGATRWDIAVRALRGDIGGQYQGEESTESEENTGQILGSLVRFPAPYTFQIVGKTSEEFVEDMMECVGSVTGVKVVPNNCVLKYRGKENKFVSIGITVRCKSADQVREVFEKIGEDDRVMMKY